MVGAGVISEPEIKFECHNKIIPLCAESLQPESEILGKDCVLRIFKAKALQRERGKKKIQLFILCWSSERSRSEKPK